MMAFNRDLMDEYEVHLSRPHLTEVHHQIGGEPYNIQRDPELRLECPGCSSQMLHVASIANDTLDCQGFAGDSGVQMMFEYCPACRIIGAFQQCD